MFKPHFLFDLPNDDTKIWRYLGFEKFISLINSQSLYFCRSDKFDDPYEGTLSNDSIEQLNRFCSQFENKTELFNEFLMLFNSTRKMTLVNCWHINDNESDGMWKLYSSTKNSVAIQSTVGKLKESFSVTDKDIFIGNIKYIDFNEEFVQAFNAMGPFIYKRKSFSHENELRAVFWNTDKYSDTEKIEFVENGLDIKINIDSLIDRIFISPTSDKWFEKVVQDILLKYNINKEIVTSNLLKVPDYLNSTDIVKKDSLEIPNDILQNFIEKDSLRIKREEEEKERTIKLQTDSIIKKLNSIELKIVTFEYKRGKRINVGYEAVKKFASDFSRTKKLKNLLTDDYFKTIYFITGMFDNLMIELFDSIIPEREKRILLKDILFLFSEKFAQGLITISVRLESENLDEDALKAIIKTAHRFTEIMTKNEI